MNRFGATHLAVKALFLRAEIDITFVPTNSYRSISSCSAKRVAHVAEKNSVLCDLRDETVICDDGSSKSLVFLHATRQSKFRLDAQGRLSCAERLL
jgi:hypothetical protein